MGIQRSHFGIIILMVFICFCSPRGGDIRTGLRIFYIETEMGCGMNTTLYISSTVNCGFVTELIK